MVRVLRANGESGPHPEHPGPVSLEVAQSIVGGYVEVVRLSIRIDRRQPVAAQMLVNEDGLSSGLDFNELASSFAPGHSIAGDAILMTGKDMW